MNTEIVDLFLVGAGAAAVAALVLVLRSERTRHAAPARPEGELHETHSITAKTSAGEAPHELLVAWVQFLKTDIMEAVNSLHNRLNAISHTAANATADAGTPALRQSLERIRTEGERAAKITTGLLHRINALAPQDMPPVLFQYDGSTFPAGHILLVENDEANQTVIRKAFERLGQKVTLASNGFEAFEALETADVDCIISDVKMPYLDGRTLFEQIEHQKPHMATRFVFVTGDFTNPATLEFLRNTGQPYIGKPYELEALLGAVAAILKNRVKDGG